MRDYFDRELTRYLDSIFDGTPAEPDPDFQREQMLELRDEVRRASPGDLHRLQEGHEKW